MAMAAATPLPAAPAMPPALAEFRNGQVVCDRPDPQRHLCWSISRVKAASGGRWVLHIEGRIEPTNNLTVALAAPLFLRDQMYCYHLTEELRQSQVVHDNGRLLAGAERQAVFERTRPLLSLIMDRDVCTRLIRKGDVVMRFLTLYGPQGSLTKPPRAAAVLPANTDYRLLP
ncbi:hypothetical protein GTZ99_08495 [Novosphingobium sp. FSY-8]|uniref:Uncharacterized protein n=2 Tax=Novosphingobium ovatum TaxID=1908523 RepID=A0ABW9XDJ5_9SPHN|nr:hypothetical protein [Novosphingobium ovatum]